MLQKNDTKQIPHWEPTYIGHHRIKFSSSGDLEPGICAFLEPSITYLQRR